MSTGAPTIRCRQFKLPKRGNATEEYEDAVAVDSRQGRFAIADGATESSFSALWARLLVEEFVRTPAAEPGRWEAWLPAVQQRWAAAVNKPNGNAASWYVETKIQQGAFAAFLGLVLDEPRRWLGRGRYKRWRAFAIGDSCLFHVREGRLLTAVPITRSTDFDNTPCLVGSNIAPSKALRKKEVRQEGEWLPHDRLYLMTDALAQWFLKECETRKLPWHVLDALLSAPAPDAAFASFIEERRSTHRLRNDDVTLLTVCL